MNITLVLNLGLTGKDGLPKAVDNHGDAIVPQSNQGQYSPTGQAGAPIQYNNLLENSSTVFLGKDSYAFGSFETPTCLLV